MNTELNKKSNQTRGAASWQDVMYPNGHGAMHFRTGSLGPPATEKQHERFTPC